MFSSFGKSASSRKGSVNKELLGQITISESSSTASFEPSVDGPPSPEQIRAYTEQLRRSSIFGHHARSHTTTSASSSIHSVAATTNESGGSGDISPRLSRRSSQKSHTSTMATRAERPESINLFGKSIFTRTAKKMRRGQSEANISTQDVLAGATHGESARDRYYSRSKSSSRRGTLMNYPSPSLEEAPSLISKPYNFQHLTHTRQEHLPNLERTPGNELCSQFSAIRASQQPEKGLKGIRAQDLYFENFSSEALSKPSDASHAVSPEISPKALPPLPSPTSERRRSIKHTKSHDSLRRSPRRPMVSPPCPIAPPQRVSSRTASMRPEDYNLHSSDRPRTSVGVLRSPIIVQTPPPNEALDYFSAVPVAHTLRTPEEPCWPLGPGITSSFGSELAEVPEEEDEKPSSNKRLSVIYSNKRASRSVPDFHLPQESDIEEERDLEYRPETGMSDTIGNTAVSNSIILADPSGSKPEQPSRSSLDNWEADIDYCYEHEADANFDYEWTRRSLDKNSESSLTQLAPSPEHSAKKRASRSMVPFLNIDNSDDETTPSGSAAARFRASLLVPSPTDTPELSPMSSMSMSLSQLSLASSELRTPVHTQPLSTPESERTIRAESQTVSKARHTHLRTASQASESSFQESQGFILSPSLLIPRDFAAQMEHEALYDELMSNRDSDIRDMHILPSHFGRNEHDGFGMSSMSCFKHQSALSQSALGEINDARSSTTSYSYRSSSGQFSRASGPRSSGLTGLTKSSSQESVILAAAPRMSKENHYSVQSTGSLPELEPSSARNSHFSHALTSSSVSAEDVDRIMGVQAESPSKTMHVQDMISALRCSEDSTRSYAGSPTIAPISPVESPTLSHFNIGKPMFVPVKTPSHKSSVGDLNLGKLSPLSPVREGFASEVNDKDEEEVPASSARRGVSATREPRHGRKVSAPLLNFEGKEKMERPKSRMRSKSGSAGVGVKKSRGYNLFPQV